ncbi:MAG TPA: serine hydrolase, partial [Sphingomicrobium sp.]|nr:serine hydrolase [Sphingomicrobium sp.]
RGMLPWGTKVEHKTGTLNGYTSDVGYITLSNGHRIAVAMFARGGGDRPRTIAEAARAIYDGFTKLFSWPTYGSAFSGAARN